MMTTIECRMRRLVAILTLTLVGGCSGDWIPFSGGMLEGTIVPASEGIPVAGSEDVVRIETQPTDPYSVNLWVIALDDDLYVHAGDNHTTWIQHLEVDPSARVGYQTSIIEVIAERVTDQPTFDRFRSAYEDKYGVSTRLEDIDQVYLYRLSARP
ncbi:MAG: DUF2255 family protein [Pseudomonadales bacterium]